MSIFESRLPFTWWQSTVLCIYGSARIACTSEGYSSFPFPAFTFSGEFTLPMDSLARIRGRGGDAMPKETCCHGDLTWLVRWLGEFCYMLQGDWEASVVLYY